MGLLKGDNGNSGFTFNGNYAVWGDADIHIGVAGTSKSSIGVFGASTDGTGVQGNSVSETAVLGFSESGRGVAGTSDKSYGVFGQSNLPGTQVINNKSNAGIGVYGVNNQSLGVGVSGEANNAGTGVLGHSDTGTGVMGTSAGSNGIHGITSSNNDSAIYGEHSSQGIGVFGRGGTTGGEGVFGQSNSGASGVYGKNTNVGIGVTGESANGIGVYGQNGAVPVTDLRSIHFGVYGVSDSGTGVNGESNSGTGTSGASQTEIGVSGVSNTGIGVNAETNSINSSSIALLARLNSNISGETLFTVQLCKWPYAGEFFGDVEVHGIITKDRSMFKIDHPLDPATKYLIHSSVESPEMKNIYDGVVVLDANGEAGVELPAWFEALNTDFRYQLTCIGGYAPVYIAQEIQNHRFTIAGGKAGLKVSWLVTGIRQDVWAKAHSFQAESEKPLEEQGYYLHPELYSEPEEKSIRQVRHPKRMQQGK